MEVLPLFWSLTMEKYFVLMTIALEFQLAEEDLIRYYTLVPALFYTLPVLQGGGLTWESYKLDPYVQRLADTVFAFQEKVTIVLSVCFLSNGIHEPHTNYY